MDSRRLCGYEIHELIGEGACSKVYRAFDANLEREIALKVLHEDVRSEQVDHRFLNEARIAARLKHKNSVQVHDFGCIDNKLFISYQLIEGVTLRQWTKFADLEIRKYIQLIVTVCNAIAEAHSQGIVHRDLKPENIIVDVQGIPYVADFGLASLPEVRLTSVDVTLGTVAYMSPEQARGESRKADPRSDVYSLGVMIFEQLAGELPARGATHAEYLAFVANKKPPRVSQINKKVSKDLSSIVSRCLELHPDDRYKDAKELSEDLVRFLSNHPVQASNAFLFDRSSKWLQRNRSKVVGGSAVALSFAFLLWMVAWFAADSSIQKEEKQVNAINLLRTAGPESLEVSINQLSPFRKDAQEKIEEIYSNSPKGSVEHFNMICSLGVLNGFEPKLLAESFESIDSLDSDRLDTFIRILNKHATGASIELSLEEFPTSDLEDSASSEDSKDQNAVQEKGSRPKKDQSLPKLGLVSLVAGKSEYVSRLISDPTKPSVRESFANVVAKSNLWDLISKAAISIDAESAEGKDLSWLVLNGLSDWEQQESIPYKLKAAKHFRSSRNPTAKAIANLIIRRDDTLTLGSLSFPPTFVPIEKLPVEMCEREFSIGDLRRILSVGKPPEDLLKVLAKQNDKGNDYPVVNITVEQMKLACDHWSRIEGRIPYYTPTKEETDKAKEKDAKPGYRLPTKKEWSTAAIGQSLEKYFFGINEAYCNRYAWTNRNGAPVSGIRECMKLLPNPYGVFDIYGNATEIVMEDGKPKLAGGSAWMDPFMNQVTKMSPYLRHSSTLGFRVLREK